MTQEQWTSPSARYTTSNIHLQGVKYNATTALGTQAVSTRDQRMKYHGRENQRAKGTSVVGAMRPSVREEKAGRKRGGPAESKPLSHGITGLLQA